jgi:hypothetical protein
MFIGEQGCDREARIQTIEARGMAGITPPRSNRIESRRVDGFVHKERHLIECSSNKI